MRMFAALSLSLFVLSLPVFAQSGTSKPAKTKILALDPGYVRIGQNNIVIISGKNLEKGMKCKFMPVSSDVGPSTDCDDPEFITGTKQLKVTLNVPDKWKSGNLIITLKSGNDTVALATILAVGADATPPPQQSSAQGSGSQSSPFANCLNGNTASSALLNPANGSTAPTVNCASSLLTAGEVKDNFGQHVEHTYFAIQVRVSNQNSNYDFLLRDILLTLPDGRVISGRIRRFAQGVAVKGKSLDRRAAFYNSIQAGTGLYGGLTVFASQAFKTAGNVLQGSFLSGFAQIFPDYTADNVNRFNTAVFDDQNPSIVPKDSIGQPPLYVVALVPKSQDAISASNFAERIAVSIEGTYIKQVSVVSLSKTELLFNREIISPDEIDRFLPPTAKDQGLAALRDAGQALSFTINNNNSTPLSVSKLRIEPGTQSSKVLTSKVGDFEVGSDTTCGSTPGKFDPTSSFTIPAQNSCIVFVRFHPMGIANSSATLTLEGTNLDGERTVKLTGQSAGLIVDAADITPATGAIQGSERTFVCSLPSDCRLELGTVDDNAVTIPVTVVGGDGKMNAPTLDSISGVTLDDCKKSLPEGDVTKLKVKDFCSVHIMDLSKVPSGTVIKLTNSSPAWTVPIEVHYEKKATAKIKPDPVSPISERDGTPAITGTVVNQEDNSPMDSKAGQVDWSCDQGPATAKVGDAPLDASGKFSIILNESPAGSHTCQLTFPAVASSTVKAATPVTVKAIIKGVVDLTKTFNPTVKAGAKLSVALNAKTVDLSTPCAGSVTFTANGANKATATPATILGNGMGTLSISVPKKPTGKMDGTLTFNSSTSFCTNPSSPIEFSYTVTP